MARRVLVYGNAAARGIVNAFMDSELNNGGDALNLEWSADGQPPATHGAFSVILSEADFAKLTNFISTHNPNLVVEEYDDVVEPAYLVNRMTALGYQLVDDGSFVPPDQRT